MEALRHTTLATTRLKLFFLAARIWRHASRVGISYSDHHYSDQSIFHRLMRRLQAIGQSGQQFMPVISIALRC